VDYKNMTVRKQQDGNDETKAQLWTMNKNEKYIVPEVLHTALRILYTRDARESAKNREGYGFPFKNESMPNSDLRA
jgi:hypothetical protein